MESWCSGDRFWQGASGSGQKILQEGGEKPENQIWLSSPFGCASSTGVQPLQQPEQRPALLRWTQGILLVGRDPQKCKSFQIAVICCRRRWQRVRLLLSWPLSFPELEKSVKCTGLGVQCWAVPTLPVCWDPSNGICCEQAAKQSF